MKSDESIASIMSTDLLITHEDRPVSEVRQLMASRGVHHILVVAGTQLLGVVSMSDILALSYSEFSDDGSLSDALLDERCTLGGLMKRSPVTIQVGASVRDAARAMSSGDFHSLPVVDGGNALVGIVTSTDLIRYLVGD